jgi:hypothetical protein
MPSCVACNHELPNRKNLIYCPSCGIQSKCKGCGVALERGDAFCVSCGTSAGSGDQHLAITSDSHHAQPLNKLEYRRERKGKDFSESLTTEFTDTVGAAFGSTVLAVVADAHSDKHKIYPIDYAAKAVDNGKISLPVIESSKDGTVVDAIAHDIEPSFQESQNNEERIKKIFALTDDSIRLIENRLKPKNRKDNTHRFIILFLYFNQVVGNKMVDRATIMEHLKKADIYDNNSSTILKEICNSKLRNENGVFSLYPAGIESAHSFIDDIFNPDIPNDLLPCKTGGSRSLKLTSDEKSDHSKKKRKGDAKCPIGEELAERWKVSSDLHIDTTTVQNLAVLKQGIVGLWAIFTLTEGQQNNVSAATLSSFYYSAFGLDVDQSNLSKRLSENVGKGLLIKKNAEFELLPLGMKEAEKIIKKVYD